MNENLINQVQEDCIYIIFFFTLKLKNIKSVHSIGLDIVQQ